MFNLEIPPTQPQQPLMITRTMAMVLLHKSCGRIAGLRLLQCKHLVDQNFPYNARELDDKIELHEFGEFLEQCIRRFCMNTK